MHSSFEPPSSSAQGDGVVYAICYRAHHLSLVPGEMACYMLYVIEHTMFWRTSYHLVISLLFYLKQFILCICVFCLPVYLYTMYVPGIYRDPKRVLDPLELELQLWASMRMLGTEPGSSAGAAIALNCWAISAAPLLICDSREFLAATKWEAWQHA